MTREAIIRPAKHLIINGLFNFNTLIIMGTCKKAILIAALFLCFNFSTYAQKITLNVNNVSVRQAMGELRKATGYTFVFSSADVDTRKKVSVSANGKDINYVIKQILKGQEDVEYRIEGKEIILTKATGHQGTHGGGNKANAQKSVSGIVTDENGDPMIGVTVKEDGTDNVAVTDLSGKFTLNNLSATASSVTLSYIGYIQQSVKIRPGTMSIEMLPDNQSLDEIVVVGYGVQKKRDLTGSVSSLKQKDIVAIPTTNVLESMQGKIAGLDLSVTSGQAGASPTFTVRGERSLTASNAPLILVDGIDYGSDVDINPSDIESIEVLKDASSTAIYGTRGANGIIMITTKKGKSGKSRISFNAFLSSTMITDYPDMMNAEQYARYKREAYRDRETGEYADDASVFAPEELEYLEKGYDADYPDMLMHNGFNQSYELSVSGGNDKTRHFFSLGYRSENGLFKDDGYKRYNGRLALDHNLFKNVQIGANVIYSYVDKDNRYSPLNQARKIIPISKPYDDDGNIVSYPSPGYNTQMNPLLDDQPGMRTDNTISERFFGNFYMNWNITKELLFRTTFAWSSVNQRRGFFAAKGSLQGGDIDSQSYKEHYATRELTWENVLTWTKDFGGIHNLQLMAGTSTIMNSEEYTYAGGKDQPYDDNIFHNLGSNEKEISIDSYLNEENLASFFGRVNYKLMERYLFTASIRADGSSVFADGKKWGYFPSVALGWRINEEPFLKNIKAISNLKLRLSWGESGQCAIDPYQTMGLLGESTYSFNNGVAYGYYPKTMSNKDLTWETTSQYNIGLDFGFLNNRISGSIDVYKAETRNVLMSRNIPSINGFTSVMENIGKTSSTGVDFSLSTVNILTKDFSWTSDFTLSHNKEKIKELASGQTKDEANAWFVGEAFKVFYDYKKIGIWQIGEEAEAAKNGQVPGDIKVADVNKDGVITPDDRIIYSQRPDVTLGFNNSFKYKDFDFTIFLYARLGQWIAYDYNTTYRVNASENGANIDYWTPENPTNAFPRPDKSKSYNQVMYYTTLAYEKGSFLKIRDITLGYTLPKSLLKRIKLSKLRLYCTAKNFFTFSGIDHYDPEAGGSIDFPMTKQLVFGINLEF